MKKLALLTILLFSLNSYAVTQKIEVLGMVCAFCAQGIDKSFNDTPGLLLSVDLPSAPEKLLKLYMGDKWRAYRGHG